MVKRAVEEYLAIPVGDFLTAFSAVPKNECRCLRASRIVRKRPATTFANPAKH